MRLTRRTLLTIAGVGVAGLVVDRPLTASARTLLTPTNRRFFGDPGQGQLYYGASLQSGKSLPGWEQQLGCTLGAHHTYFSPSAVSAMVNQADDDVQHARLPHVSIRPPSTWANVAAGGQDAWVHSILNGLNTVAGPVFLTVSPEPESEESPDGCTPADFVAMQNRLIMLNARLDSSVVTIIPVLMAWTFNPGSGRDVDQWFVANAQVIGVDAYNPWSEHNGKPWRTMATLMAHVVEKVTEQPLAIVEYGCRTDPDDPDSAAQWMTDTYNFAVDHNVVSMTYFNSGAHSPDGTWALDDVRGPVFQAILQSKTARIP